MNAEPLRSMPARRFARPLAATAAAAAAMLLAVSASALIGQEPGADAPPPPATGVAPAHSTEDRMKQVRRDELARQQPIAPGAADPDDGGPPSEEEWQAASKAMEELTPNWWRRFGNAPPGGPGHERMKHSVVTRYRELQR